MAKKATEYTKAQILGSARYSNKKDVVNALLNDGMVYTISKVDELVTQYMKGGVK